MPFLRELPRRGGTGTSRVTGIDGTAEIVLSPGCRSNMAKYRSYGVVRPEGRTRRLAGPVARRLYGLQQHVLF